MKHYRSLCASAKAHEHPLCEKILSAYTPVEVISFAKDNQICADCGTPEPKWTVSNIGCFICIKCSGIHRSLGTHVSKVLSAVIDDWSDDAIKFMESMGNSRVNHIYEHSIPANYSKPTPDSSMEDRRKFIYSKYVRKRFTKDFDYDGQDGDYDKNSKNEKKEPDSRKSTAMVEYIGVLSIHLIKGTNLIPCDISGKSDPFVVFHLGNQRVQSKIIKQTLSPVWNERFQLCVPSKDESLLMKVYDYDFGKKNDHMGRASISLKDLEDGKAVPLILPLEDVKKGLIQLELTFTSLS